MISLSTISLIFIFTAMLCVFPMLFLFALPSRLEYLEDKYFHKIVFVMMLMGSLGILFLMIDIIARKFI